MYFSQLPTYSSQMALTRVLWRMGIFHGDDDSLGEEVLVDSHQVLLGHQHDEGSKKENGLQLTNACISEVKNHCIFGDQVESTLYNPLNVHHL